MSDMQSMDRENKKRQLRQNIVQMPDAGSDEPMDDERLARYKKEKADHRSCSRMFPCSHWDLPDTDI